MKIGLDIGSTTLKAVVLDEQGKIIYADYQRHFSQIVEKAAAMLEDMQQRLALPPAVGLAISGSAGMGLAESCGIPFVQEVYATRLATARLIPAADVVIELGGEDAKVLFLTDEQSGGEDLEVRMNGSCAGGTGAFIDQMATLLNSDPGELNRLAADYDKIYTVASRCGVFAKSDIQPLINQGANKADIAASIFAAVVNQTIAGLAQGRAIQGRVVYLGGPLTFLSELRQSFDRTLGITGLFPENSLYFVAIGAALSLAEQNFALPDLLRRIKGYEAKEGYLSCAPLFRDAAEYAAFQARHAAHSVPTSERTDYQGPVYLGVDAGSTTIKATVITPTGEILCAQYLPNHGNPVPAIRDFLADFYARFPAAYVESAAATGYGEEMIKNAFRLDYGIVETVAHFKAARHFNPQVDFIIDIGGQDIKCFKIRQGTVDNIFLNEACSSGCGSFLQTFAGAWDYDIAAFAAEGIFADRPVDLGSRCTVFMNSSVKQAQKDGATLANISAGLSISVVKNALYKVIRAASADDLGQHIVVQGGTFLNDAVLRAFEQEIGREVIRPNIAGLMGAYGAALYAQERSKGHSSLLNAAALQEFRHEARVTTCQGCTNHCQLTINSFDGGRRFIGGNRCSKPLGAAATAKLPNLYEEKLRLLEAYRQAPPGKRGRIGLPLGLNLFEMLPFWHAFFTKLGYQPVVSPLSTRALYLRGQYSIPSDTVCYPAKLLHGHIEALLDEGVDAVFYPCMSYNFDEGKGSNHYNCPVVAYYPEVIKANVSRLQESVFIYDYISPDRPKYFPKKMQRILRKYLHKIPLAEVEAAARAAYQEYDAYLAKVRAKGGELLALAEKEDLPVVILAGRPYHLDPEVNHGIDTLVAELGAVVVSEDAVSHLVERFPTTVLNQWTYHSRLYAAAKYVAERRQPRLNLVQLVSFGCGVDAVTTDEVRAILEQGGKIYTQIKIDEITNLGAVKIRLRSLFAALEQEQEARQSQSA